jgi:hypothetical protein
LTTVFMGIYTAPLYLSSRILNTNCGVRAEKQC